MNLIGKAMVIFIVLLVFVSCGRKKKKVYNSYTTNQYICNSGSSVDPEIVCNPLLVGSSAGGSNGGEDSGSDGGSTSGSSGGSTSGSSGGSTSGSSGGSTSGSSGGSTSGSSGGSTSGSSGGTTGGGDVAPSNGLISFLYEGDSTYKTLDEFSARGKLHEQYVYLNNFDLPSRAWDAGFMYGENQYVLNKAGGKLIEWFSILAKGYIQLPQFLPDGRYQFIAVSDDGIKVTIEDEVILEKQEAQAPKAVCSNKAVELSKNSRKRFELKYFQGPRYHIALSLYLRRLDSVATPYQSAFCGKSATHANMLAEGWTVVPASYFFLPDEI